MSEGDAKRTYRHDIDVCTWGRCGRCKKKHTRLKYALSVASEKLSVEHIIPELVFHDELLIQPDLEHRLLVLYPVMGLRAHGLKVGLGTPQGLALTILVLDLEMLL